MKLKRLGKSKYLALGILLSGLKLGLDYALAYIFGKHWSPLFYINPPDAPIFEVTADTTYYLCLWALATPFIAVGVWLTARRLYDAGAPLWLLLLFFVPFANLLFFAACAVLPSRPEKEMESLYRTSQKPPPDDSKRQLRVAVILSVCAGSVVALGVMGVVVGVLKKYDAGLFMGAPLLSGFFTTLAFDRLWGTHRKNGRVYAVVISFLSLLLSMAVMISFAIEGLICLIMASPIASVISMVGSVVALMICSIGGSRSANVVTPAFVVPAVILMEVVMPTPAQTHMVESEVIVNMPPEEVWQHVVSFPELPPVNDWLFKVGVAAPTAAVIDGEGVGAIRRCQFTTGEFVEPIEVWDPPQELGFGVQAMPDPMKELSPYDIHPRHMDGYFRTTRGQFLLSPLEGNRTRLRGRTYYKLDMAPSLYWKKWADFIVHRIHVRVLNHVKHTSEDRQLPNRTQQQ